MTRFSKFSDELVEGRRQLSIERMERMDREEFDRWYQKKKDQLYWQNGPCCAGCDHWISDKALTGVCDASPIVSGKEVLKSIGITWSTYTPPPGKIHTKHDCCCGKFKDEFDWSTLDPEYLEEIGAKI